MLKNKLKNLVYGLGYTAMIFAGPLYATVWGGLDKLAYGRVNVKDKTVFVSNWGQDRIQLRGKLRIASQTYFDTDKDGTLDKRVDSFPVGVCRIFTIGHKEYSLEQNPEMFDEAQSLYEHL